MIKVSDSQMSALQADAKERFVRRVLLTVQQKFPIEWEAVGEDGMRSLVHRGIRLGAEHNVTLAGPVSVLVELMVAFGERFERSPDAAWAKQIFEHPKLPAPLKIGMIEERLVGRSGGRSVMEVPMPSSLPSPQRL